MFSRRRLLRVAVPTAVGVLLIGLAHRGANKLPAAEPKEEPAGESVSPAEESKPAATGLGHGEEAVLRALEETTSLEFAETPLADCVELLQEKHRIHLRLDRRGLEDVGLDPQTPISFTISQIPLRWALELMLQEFDLTWTIASGVLLITTEEEGEHYLVTRSYDVADLLVSPRDHTYGGKSLPTTPPRKDFLSDYLTTVPGGATSGSPTFSEDGIGAFTDRFSPYWAESPYSEMDGLIGMIPMVIAPESWDDVGGAGSREPYGRLLIIRQTVAIHLQIEALLDEIRAKRRAAPAVVIDARWLLLDSDLLDQLVIGGKAGEGNDSQGRVAVDPEALEQMTRAVPSFRARISCMSGHKAFLSAGDRRSVVHGAIPVVGSGIGYQPVVEIPNIGLLLGIRPSIEPGKETALLDVNSTVTGWKEPDRALYVGTHFPPSLHKDAVTQEESVLPAGEASVSVDRVNLPAQEFAATARVPLGKPILLGGLTLFPTTESDDQSDQERKQLYLVVQTDLVGE